MYVNFKRSMRVAELEHTSSGTGMENDNVTLSNSMLRLNSKSYS